MGKNRDSVNNTGPLGYEANSRLRSEEIYNSLPNSKKKSAWPAAPNSLVMILYMFRCFVAVLGFMKFVSIIAKGNQGHKYCHKRYNGLPQ